MLLKKLNLKEAIKTDLKEINYLINRSFEMFEKENFSKEGKEKFLKNINEDELRNRRNSGSRFIIATDEKDEIIGVMEVRPYNYINLFYLKSDTIEIGKKLLEECYSYCDLPNIINAPSYLEEMFENLGLQKICNQQEVEGIKFTPYKYLKM